MESSIYLYSFLTELAELDLSTIPIELPSPDPAVEPIANSDRPVMEPDCDRGETFYPTLYL